MPAKKNKKDINQIFQVQTSSLSTVIRSSNNNNNNINVNNNTNPSSSSSSTTTTIISTNLLNEILLEQNKILRENKMLQEENKILRDENEFLKKNLNQSNDQQKQAEEEKEKIKANKKKRIKRIGKILNLTYIELMKCRQETITKTCRKIIKTIYRDRQSLANEHVSTMPRETINAIRRVAKLMHPNQANTSTYILNNSIGNVFATARQ